MKGHIRWRGERSWELKFDVGADPLTGKRKTRFRSFKGSKRDAQVELARLVAEHAAGNSVDPSSQLARTREIAFLCPLQGGADVPFFDGWPARQ